MLRKLALKTRITVRILDLTFQKRVNNLMENSYIRYIKRTNGS